MMAQEAEQPRMVPLAPGSTIRLRCSRHHIWLTNRSTPSPRPWWSWKA